MQPTKRGMRYGADLSQGGGQRRRQIRNWIILVVIVLLAILGVQLLRNLGGTVEITATRLPCTADQDVTIFGDNLLYYDGASIHCVSCSGSIRWSFPVGTGARFSVSDTALVIWSGTQLFIVDANGKPTYNENMHGQVQFARIGSRYCAVVVGEDTEPELILKNLDGTQIDIENEAFSGLMLMDVGFYGDQDQYLWTLSMDVYGVAVNMMLNTFQVGRMNTGVVSLGEYLAYKVLFENNMLRVFTTQQMYTYDYKGVQDVSRTQLVYGWQLVDASIPTRGSGHLLLAPTSQMGGTLTITELRVLTDLLDRRYTLPTACVGAAIRGKNLYAISPTYLYHADVDAQRFYGYALPLEGRKVNSLIGATRSGSHAIAVSEDEVYAISLPQ